MDLSLKNRKVVITGAGEGIGRALAIAFAREGALVGVCARTSDRLNSLAEEIMGNGHVLQLADLTKQREIETFHQKILDSFRNIDILVNNVGSILKPGNFFELSDEDWQASFEINLMSAVRLTRLFIPSLKHSVVPRIINISSIAAYKPGNLFPHYSAMKAALSNLTVSLAQTLVPNNILVNSVSPGPVWTSSWEKEARQRAQKTEADFNKARDDLFNQTSQHVLLKRMGLPEDVTGLVLFLASDQANWITASNFTVDGGITQDPF